MFDISMDKAPFVESYFYDQLRDSFQNSSLLEYADFLNKNGYCVIDLEIDSDIISQANEDIRIAIEKNEIKKNPDIYHYNDSPRIVEAWKYSKAIKSIVLNKKLNEILKFCYQSRPIPFSTINFLKGSEQPLHSDEIHFGSIPHKYLTGVWVALEDIDPKSGPLTVGVKSNKMPLFSFEQIGVQIPKSEKELHSSYKLYEDWVRKMIECQNIEVAELPIKKGHCIIWLSNTLHGAFSIKDKNLTRKSLAIHFHYEKCEKVFFPSYSNLEKGNFLLRNLNKLEIK